MSEQNEKQIIFTDAPNVSSEPSAEDRDLNLCIMPKRVLPMFFVLDTSDSMSVDGRIGALNDAMEDVLIRLAQTEEEDGDVEIKVAVLQVRTDCRWITPELTPLRFKFWDNLEASGSADWADAIAELNHKLRKTEMLKSAENCLRPVIIFVTAGLPASEWKWDLDRLWENPWYQRARKIAVGIGTTWDERFLEELVRSREYILSAQNVADIPSSFESALWMIRSRSSLTGEMIDIPYKPTEIPSADPSMVDDSTGRAKCKLLKQIRKAIADANGIPYEITECHFEGHCNGACPVCDREAVRLSRQLTEKAAAGTIHMPDIDTSGLDEYLPPKYIAEPVHYADDNQIWEFTGWDNIDW